MKTSGQNVFLNGLPAVVIIFMAVLLFWHWPVTECRGETLLRIQDAQGVVEVSGEKEMMVLLVDALKHHKSRITISYPGISRRFKQYRKKRYVEFFDCLSIDAEYYAGIVSGYCIYINESGGAGAAGNGVEESVTLQFQYVTTRKQEKYIDQRVKKLAHRWKKKDTYGKIRAAHDYLVRHMHYNENYYNPYYAFRSGKGLCMSYALAFQRLMQEMRIPCVYVKGNNHAWNMVKLNGLWYNMDLTFDDAGGGHRYFLKCDADFPGHTASGSKYIRKLRRAEKSYIY